MAKLRICITIDREIYKKTRDIQAEQIRKTQKNVSFSKTLEGLVKDGLEKNNES